MAVKTLSGFRGAVYEIAHSNTTVNFESSAEILSIGNGIHAANTIQNTQINVDGTISAAQYAIFTEGKNADVDIGKTGVVNGQAGVLLVGQNSSAVNNGEINAITGYGMYQVSPDGTDLRNNGSIDAIYGIVGTFKGHIVNGDDGEIRAMLMGISIASDIGETFTVTNHGTIIVSASYAGIVGGGGDDKIINDGKLSGYVYLQGGDDTFDARGGSASSSIMGGTDDDVYIVDKTSFNIIENSSEGIDTIKSTVSYTLKANVENLVLLGDKDIDGKGTLLADTLRGNSGNNELRGLASSDHLYGNGGNDKLFGGADADYFHFATGDDHDVIMDYDDTMDIIDLSGWNAITSLSDLKSHHAHNQGADVIIEAGGDSLLIKGVHENDLDAGDFTAF
jgi:Ca2+-binding RTX toxin-like protein